MYCARSKRSSFIMALHLLYNIITSLRQFWFKVQCSVIPVSCGILSVLWEHVHGMDLAAASAHPR